MRRFFHILGLAILGSYLTLANLAVAGGHGHSNNNHSNNSNQNHNNKPQPVQGNKVVTGTKKGSGFIADPVRRPLVGNTNPKPGNFIADPIHLKPSTPLTGGAVVRDHSVPKPVSGPQPKPRVTEITNGGFDAGFSTVADGLGLDGSGFGFGFRAPEHPRQQVVDHRTPNPGHPGYGNGPYNDHNGGKGGFTPSTTGPANRTPVK